MNGKYKKWNLLICIELQFPPNSLPLGREVIVQDLDISIDAVVSIGITAAESLLSTSSLGS